MTDPFDEISSKKVPKFMTDPFDDLKSEVQNNLAALQNLLSQAEKERPTAPRQTVDELLLSLQGTREDADLLRSACRSLRRKASENPAATTPAELEKLRQREQFCERTDDELDRIQLIIEDMQRKLMDLPPVNNKNNNNNRNPTTTQPRQRQQQQNSMNDDEFDQVFGTSNSSKPYQQQQQQQKPSSASSSSAQRKNQVNDDDDGDDDEHPLANQFSTNSNRTGNSSATMINDQQPTSVLVDIRDWDRDAALKKIRIRSKRREEEENKVLADVGPPHDGTVKGRAMYYYEKFKEWSIEFVDTLTPNQRIGWLVGMSFVIVFLLFALFVHRSK